MRVDGRSTNELREIKITRNFIEHAEGSVLIEAGKTKIICCATVENGIPQFLRGTGKGWLTAEYSMLPRATNTRNPRDISNLKQNSRSVEIQRLIGRALRIAVDLASLGERTITVDCDVIQADGGTRTAAITGGYIAVVDALIKFYGNGLPLKSLPLRHAISACSVGVVGGVPLLDLSYSEDSAADVDMNVIMTDDGRFVEIQGTGEHTPFSGETFEQLLKLARHGNEQIQAKQREALSHPFLKNR